MFKNWMTWRFVAAGGASNFPLTSTGSGRHSGPTTSTPTIPGVGPISPQMKQVQARPLGTRPGADLGCNYNLHNREESFIPLTEAYSPTEPFVFGATSSSQNRRIRKWKSTARLSHQYSFDFLGPATNDQVGQKRTKQNYVLEAQHAGAKRRTTDVRVESNELCPIRTRDAIDAVVTTNRLSSFPQAELVNRPSGGTNFGGAVAAGTNDLPVSEQTVVGQNFENQAAGMGKGLHPCRDQ
ncbi:putative vesicle coat complex COPI, beta' subunit [Corchorus capsularis]|uniref:Putative vesicle coat complex COPI, beta' subunit n=1 Tax=Corchorus capsularis TaxID=210143 RepID=A0A1R3J101_COCAP|nr:putative vesicle coat complex COPI, beta' subunit [Corchorus capsularis]